MGNAANRENPLWLRRGFYSSFMPLAGRYLGLYGASTLLFYIISWEAAYLMRRGGRGEVGSAVESTLVPPFTPQLHQYREYPFYFIYPSLLEIKTKVRDVLVGERGNGGLSSALLFSAHVVTILTSPMHSISPHPLFHCYNDISRRFIPFFRIFVTGCDV
jgi:hypothetical protein